MKIAYKHPAPCVMLTDAKQFSSLWLLLILGPDPSGIIRHPGMVGEQSPVDATANPPRRLDLKPTALSSYILSNAVETSPFKWCGSCSMAATRKQYSWSRPQVSEAGLQAKRKEKRGYCPQDICHSTKGGLPSELTYIHAMPCKVLLYWCRWNPLVLALVSDIYGSRLDCGVKHSVRHTSRNSHS